MGERTDEELQQIATKARWEASLKVPDEDAALRAVHEDGAARERARIRGLTESLQRGVNSGPVTETNRLGIAAINAILNCVLAGIDATGEEEPAGAGGEGPSHG